jgi:hypothetical protein
MILIVFRKYLAVVVPIVATFGPFGAYIAAYLHGYVKAFLMFALGTVAYVRIVISILELKANKKWTIL